MRSLLAAVAAGPPDLLEPFKATYRNGVTYPAQDVLNPQSLNVPGTQMSRASVIGDRFGVSEGFPWATNGVGGEAFRHTREWDAQMRPYVKYIGPTYSPEMLPMETDLPIVEWIRADKRHGGGYVNQYASQMAYSPRGRNTPSYLDVTKVLTPDSRPPEDAYLQLYPYVDTPVWEAAGRYYRAGGV